VKTLLQLKPGEVAIVKHFADLEATCKLLTLGIVPNAKIEVVRKSPFGGAIYVKLENNFVAMRESEAASVEIEML
jgi:ferrous iron transport protein A